MSKIWFLLIGIAVIIAVGFIINDSDEVQEEKAKLFMGFDENKNPICIELEDTESEFDNRQRLYIKLNIPYYQRCN